MKISDEAAGTGMAGSKTLADLGVGAIGLQTSTEVGITNEHHSTGTVVFVTLAKEVAPAMKDIVGVFHKHKLKMIRTEQDLLEDDLTKITYVVKSFKKAKGAMAVPEKGRKLPAHEIDNLREELELVI